MMEGSQIDKHWSRRANLLAALLFLSLAWGCSLPPNKVGPPSLPTAPHPTQTGIASWYGPGFHGRPTASGVIYDQHELTAAHQTLPLGTRVMVTNLENQKSVEVSIIDRGPFLKGRIIDLSYAAAEALGMVGPGTIPVRVEVISPGVQDIRSTLSYTLQAGSFAELQNAQKLAGQLANSYTDPRQISVIPFHNRESTYYRVQFGTFTNRGEAEQQARVLAQRGFSVIIMEK